MKFEFDVARYPKGADPFACVATERVKLKAKNEHAARRRIVSQSHDAGTFVRSIELVSKPEQSGGALVLA